MIDVIVEKKPPTFAAFQWDAEAPFDLPDWLSQSDPDISAMIQPDGKKFLRSKAFSRSVGHGEWIVVSDSFGPSEFVVMSDERFNACYRVLP